MSITPTASICSAPSRPFAPSYAPTLSFQHIEMCGVNESTGAWSIGGTPVVHTTVHTDGTNGSKRLDPGPSAGVLT